MAADDQVVLELLLKNEREILRTLRLIQKALDKMGDEADDADKEVKKLDRTSGKLSRKARQTGRALRAYGDAFSGINSRAGRAVRTVGRLVTVFSTLGAGASASTLALGGVLAGFVALGSGVAAVGRGLADISKEMPETQKGFQAVGVAGRQAGVAIAKELAPELNQVFRFATAGALAIEDYSEAIAQFLVAVSGFGALGGIFGSLEQLDFVQRYLAEADKLIARQVIVKKGTNDQEKALKAQAKAYIQFGQIVSETNSDQLTQGEALARQYQLQIDAVRNMAAEVGISFEETESVVNAITARFYREQDKIQDEWLQRRKDIITQSTMQTLGAIESLARTGSDVLAREGAKGAIALFRVTQAAGVAQATINAYVGASHALATIPPPLNIPAAAAAVAQGLALVAQISAQQPPQISQKHIGSGMIGARDALMPDERMQGSTRTLTGEMNGPGGMLNRTAAQNVNDMNAGRIPSSGVQYVPAPWKHLDREQDRSARSGTSRFARALRSRSRNRDPQRGW